MTSDADADQLLNLGQSIDDNEFRIAIRCFGSIIQIVLPDESWIANLIPRLPPGWSPARPSSHPEQEISYKTRQALVSKLHTDVDLHARDPLVEALASDIEYAVAERSETYVFVHAGVVAVNGKALIFPGESHSGKSTLVAALVQQGAMYYSDEYAVVTDTGLILPFPRPIALRNDLIHPKGRTDLSAYGPSSHNSLPGIPVERVMILNYHPQGNWQVDPLDRTSAFIELCKNTVGFRQRPDMSFAHLHLLLEDSVTYEGIRADATEAALKILS